jgi:hypothetical protein
MKNILVPGVLVAACALAAAKLPPLDDAAKAKAAETAAKAAWQTKVDNYLLCKSQDKVVAAYRKTAATNGTKTAAATPVVTPPAAVAAAKSAASAPQPTASAPLAAASGTPVSASTPGPCSDPGPFAYNAPAEKPLETSGAHSPAGNATSPPSVKQDSATMAPAKKNN